MPMGPTYTITHEDGSAVTPQEAYDAFMSGPVILEELGSDHGSAETVDTLSYGGTPGNVTGCTLDTSGGKTIRLGGK